MDKAYDNHQFLQELLNCQQGLYTYIFKLLVNAADSRDVLQETNLVLLRKQDEYPEIQDFGAWAGRIAYFQVLAHRKKRQRDRHVFDDAMVQQLAQEGAAEITGENRSLRALQGCYEKLSTKDRELLQKRYADGLSAKEIAETVERTARAIAQALYRIRTTLMHCIDKKLASGETA